MTKRLRQKVGDTLVEVTLAVGIFSMVAVAVVSVVNGSTSKAQAALETTLARESVDIQADALRFIHAAANTVEGVENSYRDLWKNIVDNDHVYENDATYPNECSGEGGLMDAIKDESAGGKRIFAIDIYKFTSGLSGEDFVKGVAVRGENLYPATTFPRLALSHNEAGRIVARSEGLYIVPVQGPKVNQVDKTGIVNGENPASYEFNIHACWYAPGARVMSHVYTTVQLKNLDNGSS